MKVAIVAETFLPEINGVTNSVKRVADHLMMRGHDVLIVAPAPGPSSYNGCPVERVAGFELPGYRSLAVGLPRSQAIDRILRDFAPDVVHVAAPVLLGAAALQVTSERRIPTVAIYQTDLAAFAARYHLRAAGPAIWAWLKRVHGRADLNLAPSTHSIWELRRREIQNVRLWGRGVDHEQFSPGHRSIETRHRWGVGDDTVAVGYVGRIANEKGLNLLKHLVGIPNARLVIVGDGPARAQLQQQLPGAHFDGFRTGGELGAAFASLDVFVHPGAAETFCQAVQEAMASGLPAVVPAAGGPVDLVSHGSTGFLFPPDQPKLMRGAVEMLVNDPVRRRGMGKTAHAAVAGRSWEQLGDQLIAHYESVRQPARRSLALVG